MELENEASMKKKKTGWMSGHTDIKITSDYLEEHLSCENPLVTELEEEFGIEWKDYEQWQLY